ncbi:MAG: DNA translocase FtsK [Treponema sp.]|nr:DNA translocase FtsK [Treponema sp.]
MRSLLTRPISQFRIAAIVGALVLGSFSIILGISIGGALFATAGILPGLGGFFVDSYGLLAFIVPIYLLYAAFLLADPIYRPSRVFILSCAAVPFFTLALGFTFIRDFEFWAEQFVFLDLAGKGGLSFIVILLTLLEVLIIIAFVNLLFPGEPEEYEEELPASVEEPPQGDPPAHQYDVSPSRGRRSKKSLVILLPGPRLMSYAKAAALEGANEEYKIPPSGMLTDLQLPEPKPLASAAAFSQLESMCNGEQEYDENIHEIIIDEYNDEEVELPYEVPGEEILYEVPIAGILNQYPEGEYWIIDQATKDAALVLEETLKEFNIQAEVTGIKKGPVITMFEILPAPGVKLSKIVSLQDNIALRLAAASLRIVAPIPGKHAVGIEVPNAKRNLVSFRELIEGELLGEDNQMEIPVILGKDITGEARTVDLVQMPHLLIAGATGSGKSVCVNAMILSILYQRTPTECRLILIDPKIVELKLYNDIPHLLTPVITEPKRAFQILQYCLYEMERRYASLDALGVRDLRSYNRRIKERNLTIAPMPYIVIVIDEFADLMAASGKELESAVTRLAAMSRAGGSHLVLATQRPSIDVITGLIKSNIPSRIAFMVASKIDSRIIIDAMGAEKLLGKGDMLYAGTVDPFPVRIQGAFVSEEEVERVVSHVKTLGVPDYIDEGIFYNGEEAGIAFSEDTDPLYEKALEIVLEQGRASASYIQRRLKIGYNRAARLVEQMEYRGIVGPAQGSKPRELLR